MKRTAIHRRKLPELPIAWRAAESRRAAGQCSSRGRAGGTRHHRPQDESRRELSTALRACSARSAAFVVFRADGRQSSSLVHALLREPTSFSQQIPFSHGAISELSYPAPIDLDHIGGPRADHHAFIP